MNFLFILVFSCSTLLGSMLSTTEGDITFPKGNYHPTGSTLYHAPQESSCVSEIKVVKTEEELLQQYSSPITTISAIYHLNTKTGELKKINVVPIVERKKRMIEQEEFIIKGYKLSE